MSSRGVDQIESALRNFWNRRAATYYTPDVFGRRILGAYLVKLKPQSLIEVGCGTGELFPIFHDVPRVVAVDWSEEMLAASGKRVDRHGYHNIVLGKVDITSPESVKYLLSSSMAPFDLAVTRTVLMHIPPEKVGAAIQNLTLLSNNVLAFEFYDPSVDPQKLDWHNWHHEYVRLFRPLGYELVDSYDRPDGQPQILFHFRRMKTLKIEREDFPEKNQIKVTVQ